MDDYSKNMLILPFSHMILTWFISVLSVTKKN